MRKRLTIVFLVLILAGFASTGSAAAQPAFQAGAASATVNPPDGTFMAGYDQNRKSTGVHDDLFAKAVVFSDGKSAVALEVIDCIGLQYDTVAAIRAAAAKEITGLPLPPERIIVQSTHTHCGPDVIGIWGPDELHTGRNTEYMAKLVDTAAKTVAQAAKNLQPAKLLAAETECKGWAVNDSEPAILDNSVTILECVNSKGKPIATLTNFPCHPTVLDGDTKQISADWVGAFYKAMSSLPGEHLYLQGAVGAWIQPQTPERTFALAEKYGKDLAAKTLAAIKTAKPLDGAEIRFANKPLQMPVENITFVMMSTLGLVSRPYSSTVGTEVAWFAIGPAQFATHPGESAPDFAAQTKALMKTGPKFVLGLGLDEIGYICPTRFFEKPEIPCSKYLVTMSPGPKSGAALMEALKAIIP